METSEEKCGAALHKKIELQASLASKMWRQVLQAYSLLVHFVLFKFKNLVTSKSSSIILSF